MASPLIACYADTWHSGICWRCGAAMTWMHTLRGGVVPLTGVQPTPQTSAVETASGRLVESYRPADVHWGRCGVGLMASIGSTKSARGARRPSGKP